MPRSVSFETYAPVLIADEKFVPSVDTLVRDYLDNSDQVSAVITRRNDRLIPVVSNKAIVFPDPRYYFGRLITGASQHNASKLAKIRRQLTDEGVYDRYAGQLLDVQLGSIGSTEVETSSGTKTLVVARAVVGSCVEGDELGEELAIYNDDVVDRTQRKLNRRQSLSHETFNSLNGTIPLVSLAASASTEIDIQQLVANIGELVEDGPIHGLVEIPMDGLDTRIAD